LGEASTGDDAREAPSRGDISGDGESLDPDLLMIMRKQAVSAGITINGLPLCADGETHIVDYYAEHVVNGEGAFLVAAHGFQDLARAVHRKLVLEITGDVSGAGIAHGAIAHRS
jgi:hypothetical protein